MFVKTNVSVKICIFNQYSIMNAFVIFSLSLLGLLKFSLALILSSYRFQLSPFVVSISKIQDGVGIPRCTWLERVDALLHFFGVQPGLRAALTIALNERPWREICFARLVLISLKCGYNFYFSLKSIFTFLHLRCALRTDSLAIENTRPIRGLLNLPQDSLARASRQNSSVIS